MDPITLMRHIRDIHGVDDPMVEHLDAAGLRDFHSDLHLRHETEVEHTHTAAEVAAV